MKRWTRRAMAAVLGGLVAVGVPAAAAAQPEPTPNQAYWEDDNHLRYVGGISKDNQAVITNYGRASILIDDVTRIVPGAGCVNVSGDVTKAVLVGGPLKDYLSGEDGNDLMTAGAGDDVLWGSTGTDTLFAGSGIDQCQNDGVDALHDCETFV